MCGIAGIVRLDSSLSGERVEERARAMAETMAHRGPDDKGVWVSEAGDVGLSHRRLSIIDLSPLGRNPMMWDAGRLWITFNGEIYNFAELRAELERAGCRFGRRPIRKSFWPPTTRGALGCVNRFVGMFAFALWDAPSQTALACTRSPRQEAALLR